MTRKETDISNKRPYTLRVEKTLFNSLDLHISILKSVSDAYVSKKQWINSAIDDKLEKEKSSDLKNKYRQVAISLNIPQDKDLLLEDTIKKIRTVCSGLSKKQWIEDAIREKLEQEKHIREDAINQIATKTHAQPSPIENLLKALAHSS